MHNTLPATSIRRIRAAVLRIDQHLEALALRQGADASPRVLALARVHDALGALERALASLAEAWEVRQ
jgi:hypothetical protein